MAHFTDVCRSRIQNNSINPRMHWFISYLNISIQFCIFGSPGSLLDLLTLVTSHCHFDIHIFTCVITWLHKSSKIYSVSIFMIFLIYAQRIKHRLVNLRDSVTWPFGHCVRYCQGNTIVTTRLLALY